MTKYSSEDDENSDKEMHTIVTSVALILIASTYTASYLFCIFPSVFATANNNFTSTSNLSAMPSLGNLSAMPSLGNLSIFSLQNLLSSDPFSFKNNVSLIADINPKEFYEDTPRRAEVRGQLIPSVGVPQEIEIKISSENNVTSNNTEYVNTDSSGKFRLWYNDAPIPMLNLKGGDYLVEIKPTDEVYSGLLKTSRLTVKPTPISLEQLYQFAVAIVAFLGIIIILPNWLMKRRGMKQLAEILSNISNTYQQFRSDAHECRIQLEKLQKHYLEMLRRGKLNENSYGIIEGKIIYYLEKIAS